MKFVHTYFPLTDFGWDWGPAFVPAGIWQNIRYDTMVVNMKPHSLSHIIVMVIQTPNYCL